MKYFPNISYVLTCVVTRLCQTLAVAVTGVGGGVRGRRVAGGQSQKVQRPGGQLGRMVVLLEPLLEPLLDTLVELVRSLVLVLGTARLSAHLG